MIEYGAAGTTFTTGTTLQMISEATYVNNSTALSDFTGDGRLDIAVMSSSGIAQVWIGNGDGTFQSRQTFDINGATTNPGGLQVADMNGDGRADFVVGSDDAVKVFTSNGDGTFALSTSVALAGVSATQITDLNGDGNADIVGLRGGAEPVFFAGTGTGTLSAAVTFSLGVTGLTSITFGDINRDGIVDALATQDTASSPTGALISFLGNGDGTFRATQTTSIESDPNNPSLVDLNGDAALDVVFQAGPYTAYFGYALGNETTLTRGVEIDLSTQNGSRAALDTLSKVLEQHNSYLSNFGASRSRLEAQLNVLVTARENFAAAEQRIRDVDVADESSRLVRSTILQQVASAVLAQANQAPQLSLQLLR